MAYYSARELLGTDGKGTGKWYYTVAWMDSDDERVVALGYCAQDCPGHEAKADAYEHYRQYLLDHRTRYEAGEQATTQHKCQAAECGAWTTGAALVGGDEVYYLCDAHRTREALEPLVKVGNAWETA